MVVLGLIGLAFYRYWNPPVQINFKAEEPVSIYHWKGKKEVLKIAMVSLLNRQDTINEQRKLVKAIGEELGKKTILVYRNTNDELLALLKEGKIDVAIISTGSYMLHGKSSNVTLLAMQSRKEKTFYNGFILVPKDSSALTVGDLEGKRMLYVDPNSYSGYLSVIAFLWNQGYNPNNFFSSTTFSYSHDTSLRDVAADKVDAAAVDSYVYDYVNVKEPELIKRVRILAVLPQAGTGPVVARADLPDKERVKEVFLNLQNNSDGRAAMKALLIDRFVPANEAYYPPIKSQFLGGGTDYE